MATISCSKQSDLQKLKVKFPNMEYLDGRLYETPESDEIITEDADRLIEDHYYWAEKLRHSEIDVKDYINDYCNGYKEAFINI